MNRVANTLENTPNNHVSQANLITWSVVREVKSRASKRLDLWNHPSFCGMLWNEHSRRERGLELLVPFEA